MLGEGQAAVGKASPPNTSGRLAIPVLQVTNLRLRDGQEVYAALICGAHGLRTSASTVIGGAIVKQEGYQLPLGTSENLILQIWAKHHDLDKLVASATIELQQLTSSASPFINATLTDNKGVEQGQLDMSFRYDTQPNQESASGNVLSRAGLAYSMAEAAVLNGHQFYPGVGAGYGEFPAVAPALDYPVMAPIGGDMPTRMMLQPGMFMDPAVSAAAVAQQQQQARMQGFNPDGMLDPLAFPVTANGMRPLGQPSQPAGIYGQPQFGQPQFGVNGGGGFPPGYGGAGAQLRNGNGMTYVPVDQPPPDQRRYGTYLLNEPKMDQNKVHHHPMHLRNDRGKYSTGLEGAVTGAVLGGIGGSLLYQHYK